MSKSMSSVALYIIAIALMNMVRSPTNNWMIVAQVDSTVNAGSAKITLITDGGNLPMALSYVQWVASKFLCSWRWL
jgi:hypothetical protein